MVVGSPIGVASGVHALSKADDLGRPLGNPSPRPLKPCLRNGPFSMPRAFVYLQLSPVASLLPEAQQFEVYPARDCKIMYYLP